MIKDTEEDFLRKCFLKHGDTYDYSKVDYKLSTTKVTIICKKHGEFMQKPARHLGGQGCPICGDRNWSVTEFIEKSSKVHSGKYNYSLVKSVTPVTTCVEIICPVHGVFSQTPFRHAAGNGCLQCWREDCGRLSTQDFIVKAQGVHRDRYDYSFVNYVNSQTKVDIVCDSHGVFSMRPTKHLMGQNCPKCSRNGFMQGKPAILYVLRSGDMLKVGITGRSVSDRANEISESFGQEFCVANTYPFDFGSDAYKAEQAILKLLRGSYKNPTSKFDGCSECFLNVSNDDFKAILDKCSAVA